ncbi:MAG: hypothetical protein ACT4P7_12240 [Gemmatimonadaceae bacterium]
MTSSRILIAGLLYGAVVPAQQVRTLSKPEVELAEPFTNVAAIRELKDGRVVAIDPRDKVVQLVDFKSGALKKIGREGSGPKEYALPMALVALPGDTSAVFDPLNSRMLIVLPNGEPGDFISLAQNAQRGPGGGMMLNMSPPRYTDSKGRLYMAGSGVTIGPNGPVAAESLAILRVDRATKKTDTLGYARLPKDNVQTSGGSGQLQVRIGGGNPFAARDEWAVTPDGRVAVIRSPEYRVDWLSPSRSPGATIAYEKVKVTEGHKQQWRDGRRNATMIAVTNNNGRQSVSSGSPAGRSGPTIPDPADWPEFMPPFVGQNSIFAAPNGQLWILRTREASDQVPTYDIIDAAGKVAMRVALPPRTRVVGFGNGVVYTVRTDEDDLQYLQRFRLQ